MLAALAFLFTLFFSTIGIVTGLLGAYFYPTKLSAPLFVVAVVALFIAYRSYKWFKSEEADEDESLYDEELAQIKQDETDRHT